MQLREQIISNQVPVPMYRPRINIHIVSDTICPWCYVSKRRMEIAFKSFPDVTFDVDWFPYFLNNPEELIPNETVSSLYSRKYGEDRGKLMLEALRKAGEGVHIKWNDDRIPCSTLLSHQLMHLSKQFNKQNETINAIFAKYFIEGEDISNINVLVKIAKDVGIDEITARSYLENGDGLEIIKRQEREAKLRYRVAGVPTYMISRPDKKSYRIRFSGAQPVEVFEAAIKQILEVQ
eukprot:TRINITY_DN12081_c0_g1_i1.p1 TRINITY_DN12081_c0_g1~~TRINITY_DN12081_c0_g1_i1.p1  ORF type:complete len:235 (+),score=42.45 TRINITY_DN12081_c0_g1_i1:54-758(+)